MRWNRGHRSSDVEIRRGSAAGIGGGAINLLFSFLVRRFGWIGGLVGIGVALLLGGNFLSGGSQGVVSPAEESAARSDPRVELISFVLDDVQGTWAQVFARQGREYRRAKLVIFERTTPTGCGNGRAATGPFYCPLDQSVYLDLSFFRALDQLGAPGEFAQAYVIAHEVGHHVQNLLGTTERLEGASRQSVEGPSGTGVRIELQADCYSGVWAHSTQQRQLLEQGDLKEALEAARAVGDDHLQKREQGTIEPERWTHGSSEQRASWFQKGFEGGDPGACDTFRMAIR